MPGALDQRLEREFPEREIEVISTAMAAVNSYALVDFADEIIAQHPDAVMIYVGHNEFLGILGVGSAMRLAATPGLTRVFLAVRDWRLFQLLSRAYAGLRPGSSAPLPPAAGDSLMARVAGERSIPLGSEAFRLGAEQFEGNLSRLLATYQAAGIPVFIGTLVSNERDQMPLAVLAGAVEDAAGAAKTAYHAAQDAEAAGNYDAAREGYAWARDLDPLRFRAPSAFGEVVRRVAAANGATVVDVHAAFAAASEHGLIGERLLLEHVHPNLDGYFLLSDAFHDALIGSGLLGEPGNPITDDEARAGMPVSEIDRYFGDYKVLLIQLGLAVHDDARAADASGPRVRGRAPRTGAVPGAHLVAAGAGRAASPLPGRRRPAWLRARHADPRRCVPVRRHAAVRGRCGAGRPRASARGPALLAPRGRARAPQRRSLAGPRPRPAARGSRAGRPRRARAGAGARARQSHGPAGARAARGEIARCAS